MTRITLLKVVCLALMLTAFGAMSGCLTSEQAEARIASTRDWLNDNLTKADEKLAAAEDEVSLARAVLTTSENFEGVMPETMRTLVERAKATLAEYPALRESIEADKASVTAIADEQIAKASAAGNRFEATATVVGFIGAVILASLTGGIGNKLGKVAGIATGAQQVASIIATGRAVDPNFDAAFKSETPATSAMKGLLTQLPDTVRDTIRTENKSAKAAA